jgi:hypothetical protein
MEGELMMPKYRVTATMDVGYEAIVEAPDEDTAWSIAPSCTGWVQVDEGHDWTLESIQEIEDE